MQNDEPVQVLTAENLSGRHLWELVRITPESPRLGISGRLTRIEHAKGTPVKVRIDLGGLNKQIDLVLNPAQPVQFLAPGN